MANIFAIVSFLFGSVLALAAAASWCCIVFPVATRRSRVRLEAKFWRSLIAGVIVLAVSGVMFGGFLLSRPLIISWFSECLGFLTKRFGVNRVPNDAMMLAHMVGWGLICPLLSTGLIGLAAVAEIFSGRMLARKQTSFSMLSVFYGSTLPLMSCCIPFVGWYFVAPVLGLACLGSGFCGVFFPTSVDECVAPE